MARIMYADSQPLTCEEQAIAQQRHGLVWKYLRKNHLPESDWYDVVIFGYLRAIRKWLNDPKARKWSFSTVAFHAMDTSVANERTKQKRRIAPTSLEAFVPGTDGITLGEIVTDRHLHYIPYLSEGEKMNPEYIAKPWTVRPKSAETLFIEAFLMGADEQACMEYGSVDIAKRKINAIYSRRKRHNLQDYYNVRRDRNKVYVSKGPAFEKLEAYR